jgi:hypothetical protein
VTVLTGPNNFPMSNAALRKPPVAGNAAYLDPEFSDAAKRMAAAMTLHAIGGNAGRWASFYIGTGHEVIRHTAYASRIEAVRFAKWDRDRVVYLEIVPGGMEPKEAGAYLQWARFLHSRGWRLPSPDFDYDGGMPHLKSDRLAMARHLISGGSK